MKKLVADGPPYESLTAHRLHQPRESWSVWPFVMIVAVVAMYCRSEGATQEQLAEGHPFDLTKNDLEIVRNYMTRNGLNSIVKAAKMIVEVEHMKELVAFLKACGGGLVDPNSRFTEGVSSVADWFERNCPLAEFADREQLLAIMEDNPLFLLGVYAGRDER